MSDPAIQGAEAAPVQAKKFVALDAKGLEELSAKTGLKLDLGNRPATPDAHQFIRTEQQKLGRYEADWLWRMVQARARNAGRQLELSDAQATLEAFQKVSTEEKEKREEQLDLRIDDEGTAEYQSEKAPCGFTTIRDGVKQACGLDVELMTWQVIRNGVVQTYPAGPVAGKPIRKGVFGKTTAGEAVPLCKGHRRAIEQMDPPQRTYPFAEILRQRERAETHQESLSQFMVRTHEDRVRKFQDRGVRSNRGDFRGGRDRR